MKKLAISMVASVVLVIIYGLSPALFTAIEWVFVSVVISVIIILAEGT
jgi:hypothetical protein